MKKYIALLFFCNGLFATPIVLENPILHTIDGRTPGMNAEGIGMIKRYQSKILDMVLGKQTKEGRCGWYEFEGKKYSLTQLAHIEESLGSNASEAQKKELHKSLRLMRDDMEKISIEFEELSKAAKPVMTILMIESCQKRNRNDSLLLVWAQSNESEYKLFDKHITSIRIFETFLTDLYNFLNDFMHSCPKALHQFQERLSKFSKLKEIIVHLGEMTEEIQHKFLKYCHHFLDKLHLNDITVDKVKELYQSFLKSA